VAVEFLCVFLIAGELFYDLEYEANPNISDIGDALYWSFLTLTGIGQPFEVGPYTLSSSSSPCDVCVLIVPGVTVHTRHILLPGRALVS